MFNKLFSENHAFFFLDYVGKYGRAEQATIRFLRFSCWIPKATQTHLEYVLVIAPVATMGTRTRFSIT